MKLSTLTALATLLGTMALPALAPAQGRGRGNSDYSRDDDQGKGQNRGRGKAKGKWKNKDRNRDDRRNGDNRNDANRYGDNDNRRYNDRDDYRYGDRNGSSTQAQSDRRQQTKNEWRNIAYAAGAVSILGLLKKDNTLTFAGAAGALYSLSRYEQDRKSQNSLDRGRAAYFNESYFVRDGVRYDRKSVNRNGNRYYQFVRGR